MARKATVRPRGARKLLMSPAWVEALKPEPRPVEWRDTHQRGLILRVETSGRRTWIARYSYEGRERRFTLGSYPETTLKKARDLAMARQGEAQQGSDPQAAREKARLGDTVSEALDLWLKSAETRAWRPRSREAFEGHVRLRIRPRLGTLKVPKVERRHVQAMLEAIPGAPARNRTLTTVRLFIRWCVGRGVATTDPTVGIGKLEEAPRARTLTDAELKAMIQAFDGTRWRHYFRVLALTAVRRDELLGARRADLDLEAGLWTIPPADEKAGRSRAAGKARQVVLSASAVDALKAQLEDNMGRGVGSSAWVFPTAAGLRAHRDALKTTLNLLRGRRGNGSTPKSKRPAKKREALIAADAGLHDVRRTVADRLLNRHQVAPYVVDVGVLGHQKPALLGVYAPGVPLAETRSALELWSGELARILTGEPAREGESRA